MRARVRLLQDRRLRFEQRRCFVSTLVTKSDDSFRPVCNAIFSSLPRGSASGSDAINTLTKYAYTRTYFLRAGSRMINF